jgi:hypothetical protein
MISSYNRFSKVQWRFRQHYFKFVDGTWGELINMIPFGWELMEE